MSWYVNKSYYHKKIPTICTFSEDSIVKLCITLFVLGVMIFTAGIFLGRWLVLSNLNILN